MGKRKNWVAFNRSSGVFRIASTLQHDGSTWNYWHTIGKEAALKGFGKYIWKSTYIPYSRLAWAINRCCETWSAGFRRGYLAQLVVACHRYYPLNLPSTITSRLSPTLIGPNHSKFRA